MEFDARSNIQYKQIIPLPHAAISLKGTVHKVIEIWHLIYQGKPKYNGKNTTKNDFLPNLRLHA